MSTNHGYDDDELWSIIPKIPKTPVFNYSKSFLKYNQLHYESAESNPERQEKAIAYITTHTSNEMEKHAVSTKRESRYIISFKTQEISQPKQDSTLLYYNIIQPKPRISQDEHQETLHISPSPLDNPPKIFYQSDFYRAISNLHKDAPEIAWTVLDLHSMNACLCSPAERQVLSSCNHFCIQAKWTWIQEADLKNLQEDFT